MYSNMICAMAKVLEMKNNVTTLMSDGDTSGNTSTEKLNGQNIGGIVRAVRLILTKIVGPILSVIGVIMVVLVIKLGIDYARAEDADARKKVQGRLIAACIGMVIMIVGIVLCFAVDFASIYASIGGEKHNYKSSDGDNYCDTCGATQNSGIHNNVVQKD